MYRKQVYAISDNAKDVRGVVSHLNTQRGEREQAAIDSLIADPDIAIQAAACNQQALQQQQQPAQRAPWTDFLATQVSRGPTCAWCMQTYALTVAMFLRRLQKVLVRPAHLARCEAA